MAASAGRATANPLQKTHNIAFEARRVRYPWHRWHGLSVLTRKAGGAHSDIAYFCKLPEAPLHAMLVEVPKWMFDAVECATMQLSERPKVDCGILRVLQCTITEQIISVKAEVLEPLLSRQAGHGEANGSDHKNRTNDTTGSVRRTTRRTELEQSPGTGASRSVGTAGATARQCPDGPISSRLPRPGRA